MDELQPELLVACPPCTHHGGWDHINRLRRSPLETARPIRRSRKHVAFCARQIRKQVKSGDFVFERHGLQKHGKTLTWLLWKRSTVSEELTCVHNMQKATGIMCHSPSDRRYPAVWNKCPHILCRMQQSVCQSNVWPQPNTEADGLFWTRSSSWSSRSSWMPGRRTIPGVEVAEPPAEAASVPADASVSRSSELAIKKLHTNLGQPSMKDLVTILRHSNASAEAIRAEQQFECSICKNHARPASQLPARTSRIMRTIKRSAWMLSIILIGVQINEFLVSTLLTTPLLCKSWFQFLHVRTLNWSKRFLEIHG